MKNKEENQDSTIPRASFVVLLSQLVNNSVAMVRDEITLAIQRVSEKIGNARRGLLLLATGAIFSLAALLCLCTALIIALMSFMSPMLAALIVGIALALCGGAISFVGYRLLKK
jgi:VIT1/CCC1 family predicted Fe2+/Mn2+ transporter